MLYRVWCFHQVPAEERLHDDYRDAFLRGKLEPSGPCLLFLVQVVVLDLGESDGIEIGNVVGVYQSGEMVSDRVEVEEDWRVRDRGEGAFDANEFKNYLGKKKSAGEQVQLPEEFAAVVMVFRTFGEVSYGLVMEATAPIHLNDMVRNL